MATPALLLLLVSAAAAVNVPSVDISTCPITFHGHTYNYLELKVDGEYQIIFKDEPSPVAEASDYLSASSLQLPDKFTSTISPTEAALTFGDVDVVVKCFIEVTGTFGDSDVVDHKFYIFEDATGGGVGVYKRDPVASSDVKTFMETNEISTKKFPVNIRHLFVRFDGCRYKGPSLPALFIPPGQNRTKYCIESFCSTKNKVNVTTLCRLGKCSTSGICTPMDLVCTVSGPTIIPFFGSKRSILDRCDYTLLSAGGTPDISVVAHFRERQRMDVPFLDTVVVTSGGADYILGQDGSLTVNQKTVALSHAPTTVGPSLTATKDHRELALRFAALDLVVLFDGNTLHVAGKQNQLNRLDGLCGDPSNQGKTITLNQQKVSPSPSGCDTPRSQAADSSVNCTAATLHCKQLSQAPFSSCHSTENAQPFIDACTSLLCKYPCLDGVWCQFLEAYVTSCDLQKNLTFKEWRSMAGCPAEPTVFCDGRYCSSNEFCTRVSGRTQCACRSVFADQASDPLGYALQCINSQATLSLAGCLLDAKGIDYKKLHLNDPECTGVKDPEDHLVYFTFNKTNTCASKAVMDNNNVVLQNTIKMKNSAASSTVISRRTGVFLDFSCTYVKPKATSPVTVAFRVKDGSVSQKIQSGEWSFTVTMKAYIDPDLTCPIQTDTEVLLDQRVWMELKTDGLNEDVVSVVTDNCWATNVESPTASTRYDLIIRGCPNQADGTVEVMGNGMGTSTRFSFDMFQFTSGESEFFLHCNVRLCLKKMGNCSPDCSHPSRRRRAAWAFIPDPDPAVVTMTWTH